MFGIVLEADGDTALSRLRANRSQSTPQFTSLMSYHLRSYDTDNPNDFVEDGISFSFDNLRLAAREKYARVLRKKYFRIWHLVLGVIIPID